MEGRRGRDSVDSPNFMLFTFDLSWMCHTPFKKPSHTSGSSTMESSCFHFSLAFAMLLTFSSCLKPAWHLLQSRPHILRAMAHA